MTNFPSSGAAQKLNFANGKRRKIIVQHEAFFGLAFERFQSLHVIRRAQSRRHQGLCFSAREDRRPVRARQHAHFNPDVPDLIECPRVRTALLVDHLLPENPLTQHFVIMLQLLFCVFVVFRKRRFQFLLDLLHQRVALGFRMLFRIQSIHQSGSHLFLQIIKVLLIELRGRHGSLGLA